VSELGVLIATMRSQVPPVPYRQIAAQLGISVGKVQRELARANMPEAAAGAAPRRSPSIPRFQIPAAGLKWAGSSWRSNASASTASSSNNAWR
jgi:hypothetical protein